MRTPQPHALYDARQLGVRDAEESATREYHATLIRLFYRLSWGKTYLLSPRNPLDRDSERAAMQAALASGYPGNDGAVDEDDEPDTDD